MYQDYAAFVREPMPAADGREYRLAVTDEVVVTRRRGAAVHETRHTLAGDGGLWVDGLGVVAAVGRPVAEVAAELDALAREADGGESKDNETAPADDLATGAAGALPRVAVRVEAHAGRKLFVFGQVERPGAMAYTATDRLLETVAAAAPTVRADVERVLVLRPSADGSLRRRLTVDLRAMIERGDTTLNVLLEEGDVVYVPPTRLGSAGLAWAQLFGDGTAGTATQDTPAASEAWPGSTSGETAASLQGSATEHHPGLEPVDRDAELREAVDRLAAEVRAWRNEQRAEADPLKSTDQSTAGSSAPSMADGGVAWGDAPSATRVEATQDRFDSAASVTVSTDLPDGRGTPRDAVLIQPTRSVVFEQTLAGRARSVEGRMDLPGALPPGSGADAGPGPTRGGAGEGATPQGVRFWGPG